MSRVVQVPRPRRGWGLGTTLVMDRLSNQTIVYYFQKPTQTRFEIKVGIAVIKSTETRVVAMEGDTSRHLHSVHRLYEVVQ